jgi:hypothetical protein
MQWAAFGVADWGLYYPPFPRKSEERGTRPSM